MQSLFCCKGVTDILASWFMGFGNWYLSSHLSLDKMAAVLEDTIFKCTFLNENDRIPIYIIQISLKFVPKSPIDNKSVLV